MREVAEQTGALFIDLHNLTADYLDKEGQEKAAAYYNHDHTHTSKKGAELNAKMLAKGLKEANCPLAKSIKLALYNILCKCKIRDSVWVPCFLFNSFAK